MVCHKMCNLSLLASSFGQNTSWRKQYCVKWEILKFQFNRKAYVLPSDERKNFIIEIVKKFWKKVKEIDNLEAYLCKTQISYDIYMIIPTLWYCFNNERKWHTLLIWESRKSSSVLWLWLSHLNTLCFGVLVYKMDIMQLTSEAC